MMQTLLSKFRAQKAAVEEQRAAEAVSPWAEYRSLLAAISAKGKLTEKQNDRLVELTELLGVNNEELIELHVAAVKVANDLDAKIAERDDWIAKEKEVADEHSAVLEEIKRLQSKAEDLRTRRINLDARVRNVTRLEMLREWLGDALPTLIDGDTRTAHASRFHHLRGASETRELAYLAERAGVVDGMPATLHASVQNGMRSAHVTTHSPSTAAGCEAIGLEVRR